LFGDRKERKMDDDLSGANRDAIEGEERRLLRSKGEGKRGREKLIAAGGEQGARREKKGGRKRKGSSSTCQRRTKGGSIRLSFPFEGGKRESRKVLILRGKGEGRKRTFYAHFQAAEKEEEALRDP